MTGPEHYRAAELLLDQTAGPWIDPGEEWQVAAAQVHATLALAAAVAVNNGGGGMAAADYNAWHHAASEKEKLREATS